MLNNYLVSGTIEEGFVEKIFEILRNDPGQISISIRSNGGSKMCNRIVLNALNENKDRVKLVAFGGVYSAAFVLFYFFEGKKAMVPGTTGMYHQSSVNLALSSRGQIDGQEDRLVQDENRRQYNIERGFASSFMTKSELKTFCSNRDVYFSFERMKEIFPNVEILGNV